MPVKRSYYNVVVPKPENEGYVVYNTLHQSLCELTCEEKRLYDQIGSEGFCADEFEAMLAEGGFALADPELEAAYLEYCYDKYKYNTEVLELVIAPTLECNNRCIYCYEKAKRPGRMTREVQDAVFSFVEEKWDDAPFKKLKVSWFGGEPLLCLGVIEALSARFIGFCDEHDVEYIAHLVSNIRLANEEVSTRLAACKVYSAMPSFDGMAERHDCRRCSKSGAATFDTIMDNVGHLTDAGITVNASFLLDKSNFEDFHVLGGNLIKRKNVMVRSTQLRDYYDDFDEGHFAKIRLATREEYSRESFRFFMEQNPDAPELECALRPIHLFCGTPVDNWWVIDELGGVYKCIGEIGEENRRIFDLTVPVDKREVNWAVLLPYLGLSPLRDNMCRTCRVLPLCQGECAFERSIFSRNCRTLFWTIEDYVGEYYKAVKRERRETCEANETKILKRPRRPSYADAKIGHYELRLCGGSVEPGYERPKASV